MAPVRGPLHFRLFGMLAGFAAATWFASAGHSQAETAPDNGPQIEYIAPDGKLSSLSAANPTAHQSNAAFVDSSTVSCALKQGETTFIIELPRNADSDRFTFLNEN